MKASEDLRHEHELIIVALNVLGKWHLISNRT
jgi:hypothetical protein